MKLCFMRVIWRCWLPFSWLSFLVSFPPVEVHWRHVKCGFSLFVYCLLLLFCFFSLVPLCSGLCSFPLVFWWTGSGEVDRRIYQMERYGFRLVLGECIDRYICREWMHPRGPWLLTWVRLIYQLRLGCILCCWRK